MNRYAALAAGASIVLAADSRAAEPADGWRVLNAAGEVLAEHDPAPTRAAAPSSRGLSDDLEGPSERVGHRGNTTEG